MTEHELSEARQQYILPVFLGNTVLAHRLSARLFHHFGIVSYICGRRRLADLLDFASRTVRMPEKAEPRLCVETWIAFADTVSETLPILIPCSREAKQIVQDYRTLLESRFILSNENELLSLALWRQVTEAYGDG